MRARTRRKWARGAARNFTGLRECGWRITSDAMADANLGGVVPFFVAGCVALSGFLALFVGGFATAILNEIGFFAPWPRARVRLYSWAVTLLSGPGAIVAMYQFFPSVRPIVDATFNL